MLLHHRVLMGSHRLYSTVLKFIYIQVSEATFTAFVYRAVLQGLVLIHQIIYEDYL